MLKMTNILYITSNAKLYQHIDLFVWESSPSMFCTNVEQEKWLGSLKSNILFKILMFFNFSV